MPAIGTTGNHSVLRLGDLVGMCAVHGKTICSISALRQMLLHANWASLGRQLLPLPPCIPIAPVLLRRTWHAATACGRKACVPKPGGRWPTPARPTERRLRTSCIDRRRRPAAQHPASPHCDAATTKPAAALDAGAGAAEEAGVGAARAEAAAAQSEAESATAAAVEAEELVAEAVAGGRGGGGGGCGQDGWQRKR